jgi:uncharacterized membrane protein
LLMGCAVLGSIFLAQLALYLQWSPVGAPYVFGLQGRYYLPIAILVSALIPISLRLKDIPVVKPLQAVGLYALLLLPALLLIKHYM